jgi:hypothetical protein
MDCPVRSFGGGDLACSQANSGPSTRNTISTGGHASAHFTGNDYFFINCRLLGSRHLAPVAWEYVDSADDATNNFFSQLFSKVKALRGSDPTF